MSSRLSNVVAVVTGAGSGQGLATAQKLLSHGAKVMAADIHETGLDQIHGENGRLLTSVCDVTKPEEVQELIDKAEASFGFVNAMLNCAGILNTGTVTETSREVFDKVLDVNFKGVFYGCQSAIPALQRAGGGAIVNWGSINSMVAEPELSVYSATKGAVLMLTKSIAVDYAKDNIRAVCLCPGGVRTPMVTDFFDKEILGDQEAERQYQPLGLISPEEVADAAAFLVSDEARKMTGTAFVLDGGYTAL